MLRTVDRVKESSCALEDTGGCFITHKGPLTLYSTNNGFIKETWGSVVLITWFSLVKRNHSNYYSYDYKANINLFKHTQMCWNGDSSMLYFEHMNFVT